MKVWLCGDTSKSVREILQVKVLGPWKEFGTGPVPGDLFRCAPVGQVAAVGLTARRPAGRQGHWARLRQWSELFAEQGMHMLPTPSTDRDQEP